MSKFQIEKELILDIRYFEGQNRKYKKAESTFLLTLRKYLTYRGKRTFPLLDKQAK
jgi:hypothetical protein